MRKIGYLVHDLGDSNVARRIDMFRRGGADVAVAGLMRGDAPIEPLHGIEPLCLGRSEDARLLHRAASVGRIAMLDTARLARHFEGVDAIVARNLEMLVVADRLRARLPGPPALVYECIDIHRLLVSSGVPGRAIRLVERRLASSTDLVLTSSPAFIENHLGPVFGHRKCRLVENKVLEDSGNRVMSRALLPGPPWRIGFFGALRCRTSLEFLTEMVARSKGRIELKLRGRPSRAVFPDFQAEIADRPGVSFDGPFRNPDDLPMIYGGVHFAWSVDFYERGYNSSWLLPNRIYEGGFHRAIPVALNTVETGRFLDRHGVGITAATIEELRDEIEGMTPARYAELIGKLEALPKHVWQASNADCGRLVSEIVGARARPLEAAE